MTGVTDSAAGTADPRHGMYNAIQSGQMAMDFEWGEAKNALNFKKHGIWFEEGQTVWADPQAVEFFDPDHSTSEDRFIRAGHSRKGRVLLVVFCERRGGHTIRILSARKATPKEVKRYEEGI